MTMQKVQLLLKERLLSHLDHHRLFWNPQATSGWLFGLGRFEQTQQVKQLAGASKQNKTTKLETANKMNTTKQVSTSCM